MEIIKSSFLLCLSLLMSDASMNIGDRFSACALAPIGIEKIESVNNFDHFDLYALIIVESRWDAEAISSHGACGLTQVVPKYSNYSCQDLLNPEISLDEGVNHLGYWMKRASGDKRFALCGYSWGNSCIQSRKKRENDHPGLKYADRVLGISTRLRLRYEKYEKHLSLIFYNLLGKMNFNQLKTVNNHE